MPRACSALISFSMPCSSSGSGGGGAGGRLQAVGEVARAGGARGPSWQGAGGCCGGRWGGRGTAMRRRGAPGGAPVPRQRQQQRQPTGAMREAGGCARMKALMSWGVQLMSCSLAPSACSRFMLPSMACGTYRR
jgi:hypothetical protein